MRLLDKALLRLSVIWSLIGQILMRWLERLGCKIYLIVYLGSMVGTLPLKLVVAVGSTLLVALAIGRAERLEFGGRGLDC